MKQDQHDHRPKMARRLGKEGMAAIEFGLIVPFLAAMLLCCAEIGFFIAQTMQVNMAVAAGVTVAAQQGFDAKSIENAIVTDTGKQGIAASPAPVRFCGCVNNGAVTQTACDGTCPGNLVPGHYARISATLKPQSIVPAGLSPLPDTINVQSTTRLN
jgi:Flp pilus assembly protein TadG